MKTIKNLINKHVGRRALIICAGSTIKTYKSEIDTFISKNKPIVIGVNNITGFFVPHYHLWTNTKRFRDFGKNISRKSELLLGAGIHLKTVKDTIGNREYTVINYTDMKEGIPLGYKKGKILGFFRTAGNLSVMIAHLIGTSDVSIVGMDGHTLHEYRDVYSGKKSHHCYEENYKPHRKEFKVS